MGPVSSRQRHTQRTHQLVIYTFVCFFLRVWFECSNNICADKRQKRMCRNTYFFFFFHFVCDVSLCRIFDCPFMVLITEVVSLSPRRLYTTSGAHTYCLTAVVHVFPALSLPRYLFSLFDTIDEYKVRTSIHRYNAHTHEVNRSNHLFFEREKLHACWQTIIINGHLVTVNVADVNSIKSRFLWPIEHFTYFTQNGMAHSNKTTTHHACAM